MNKGIMYLDSAASSLTPEQVVLKEMEFYREYRANVERGVHRFSQMASEEFENAHEEAARFIGAPGRANVAMMKNTTEGINLVANSIDWKLSVGYLDYPQNIKALLGRQRLNRPFSGKPLKGEL